MPVRVKHPIKISIIAKVDTGLFLEIENFVDSQLPKAIPSKKSPNIKLNAYMLVLRGSINSRVQRISYASAVKPLTKMVMLDQNLIGKG